jgi:hypothetical protein
MKNNRPKTKIKLSTIDLLFILILISTFFQIYIHRFVYANGFLSFVQTWHEILLSVF